MLWKSTLLVSFAINMQFLKTHSLPLMKGEIVRQLNFDKTTMLKRNPRILKPSNLSARESKRSNHQIDENYEEQAERSFECDKNVCLNGGSCHKMVVTALREVYQCECTIGFYGSRCQYDAVECMVHPCTNGGKCVKSHAYRGFECVCLKGFHGTFCQKMKRRKIGGEDHSAIKEALTSSQEHNASIGSKYTVLELILVLITIYSFFLFLVFLVERDRRILEERYHTMVMARMCDVRLPRLEFFRVFFRRMKCICLSICLLCPGGPNILLTEDDYLLHYPFPTESLIDLGKANILRKDTLGTTSTPDTDS